MLNFDLKWLTLLALVVLVGAFAFGATSISAALDPLRAAEAKAKIAQTTTQEARDKVDLLAYAAQQQTQLEAEKQLALAQTEFEKQRIAKLLAQMDEQAKFEQAQHVKQLALLDEQAETERQKRAQDLAQAEERARILAVVLDWGGRTVAVGIALAMVIAASGFALKQFAQARAVVVRQPAQAVAMADAASARQFTIELGRVNDRIQTRLDQMGQRIENLETMVMQMQTQPRGDGHEPVTTGTLKRLTLVK